MSTEQGSRDVITRLQSVINDCLSPFVDNRSFALLDFPDHSNVGDSAIFLGELAFFKKLGRSPAYVCAHDSVDWEALERRVPDGPIFLHGGGNFGDLWLQHHMFRLNVLRRFPKRQIIQLPQSIHFQNESSIAETREAIATHGAFVLTVRDLVSFEFGKQHFDCEVILCPDMAFCIGPQTRQIGPIYDEVYILRTDLEQIGTKPMIKDNSIVTDWLQEPNFLRRKLRLERAFSRQMGRLWRDKTKYEMENFHSTAQQRVEKGYRLLSAGRHVTSDRLHVHIISTLLDIPHTVLDNNYRKIHRFIDAWNTAWSGVSELES